MSQANDIAIAYAKGLTDAVRKKNTESLFGKKEITDVEPEGMEAGELDDGTIEEILAAQSSDEAEDMPSGELEVPQSDVPPMAEEKLKKPIR